MNTRRIRENTREYARIRDEYATNTRRIRENTRICRIRGEYARIRENTQDTRRVRERILTNTRQIRKNTQDTHKDTRRILKNTRQIFTVRRRVFAWGDCYITYPLLGVVWFVSGTVLLCWCAVFSLFKGRLSSRQALRAKTGNSLALSSICISTPACLLSLASNMLITERQQLESTAVPSRPSIVLWRYIYLINVYLVHMVIHVHNV